MAEIWPTHGPTAPTDTQTNTRKHRAGAGVTLGDDLEFKFWAFYADLGVLRGYGPIWAVCGLQTRPHAEFWPTRGPTVPGHTHASVWKRHTGGGVPRAAVSNLIGGICGSILGLISAGFGDDLGRNWPLNHTMHNGLVNQWPCGPTTHPEKIEEAPWRPSGTPSRIFSAVASDPPPTV